MNNINEYNHLFHRPTKIEEIFNNYGYVKQTLLFIIFGLILIPKIIKGAIKCVLKKQFTE